MRWHVNSRRRRALGFNPPQKKEDCIWGSTRRKKNTKTYKEREVGRFFFVFFFFGCGGAAKKKIDGPPRAFTKSQTHPPTPPTFFFLTFYLVRFWAFLGKGSSKTPLKYFCKKSMSKTFPKILIFFFDVSFSSIFFVLSRFRVFLSDGSSKTLQKTFCKKIVSKSFYKKFDQKSKTDFFSNSFYHVFGRFSMRGVQKHDKKNIEKINLTLVLFRTSTHPPTRPLLVGCFLFLFLFDRWPGGRPTS
jgi:hypothetical protein